MASIEPRVAIVTGGGRGLGRAYCEHLAEAGLRVVVGDLGVDPTGGRTDEDPAAEVATAITGRGGEAVAVRADVGDPAGAEALVAAALERWGAIDVVVNNAGIGRPRTLCRMEDDDWREVFRVHVDGTFLLSRAAGRWWRDEAKAGRPRAARLVNTGTGVLLRSGAGQANYVAAKAAIVAFTEAVATELEPYGVTANCVFPTAETRLMSEGRAAALRAESVDDELLTDPARSAALVAYLASVEAGWVSGQSFRVWGRRIDHVRSFTVDASIEVVDDLRLDLPRLFGAGTNPRP